jgi:hypothetical protein
MPFDTPEMLNLEIKLIEVAASLPHVLVDGRHVKNNMTFEPFRAQLVVFGNWILHLVRNRIKNRRTEQLVQSCLNLQTTQNRVKRFLWYVSH